MDTVDDGLAEADETFAVTLSVVGESANTATATATIGDNDGITASLAADEESVKEGLDATFTVTLTGGTTNENVVVKYTVAGGAGNPAEKEDYQSSSSSLTIPAVQSSATIVIATTADDVREPDESLKVTLTEAKMGTVTAVFASDPDPEEAEITILEARDAVLVSVADTTVSEGSDATFRVTLTGEVSADVAMTYDIAAVAPATAADIDLTALQNLPLTIEAGETTATITVPTKPDMIAEGANEFTVTLEFVGDAPAGVSPGKMSATATIRDDDSLRVNVTGPERVIVGQPIDFPVTLTGGTGHDNITVHYREGDTTDTVTINVGQDEAQSPIRIQTTGRDAGDTVTVILERVTTGRGSVSVGTSRASTTLMSDGTSTVKVEVTTPPAEGGDDAVFTVSRSDPSGTPINTDTVTVRYATASGSATTAADFTAKSGPLTLGNGDSATITVDIEGDDLSEGPEKFTLQLTGNLATGVVYETRRAEATITDDDGTITAKVTNGGQETVREGETAAFPVELDKASSTPVVVSYTVGGSATEDKDYTAPSRKLTIPASRKSGTITIPTLDDDLLEPAESLVVALASGTTADRAVTVETTSVEDRTITIGESAATVLVSVADTTVSEGSDATFRVTLTGEVSADVAMTYDIAAVAPATAADIDLTALQNLPLTIEAGETTATITVPTKPDMIAEGANEFTVTLEFVGDAPAGVSPGKMSATATIRDDDSLRVNVTGPERVIVGQPIDFPVTLTGGTGHDNITVHYREGDTTDTVTINVGQDEAQSPIRIQTTGRDAGDTVTVILERVTTGRGSVSVGTSRASTTLMSDGTSTVKVEVTTPPAEGGDDAVFTVSRSDPSGTPINTDTVTVRYATASGSATTAADFTAKSGPLTLGNGDSATITVDIEGDDLSEGPEKFTLQLTGNLATGVVYETRRAEATITDDDGTITAKVTNGGQETVREGETAAFPVELDKASSTPVVVSYTVGGSATEDKDYTAPSRKLTIPASRKSGTITIPTLDDDLLEPAESLVVALASGTTADRAVTVETTSVEDRTITIAASDGPVLVSLPKTIGIDEGETAEVTVTLSDPLPDSLAVMYSTQDDTPLDTDPKDGVLSASGNPTCDTDACDYVQVRNERLVINAGETTATFLVETREDERAEASETFTVTLEFAAGAGASGLSIGVGTAKATITDDRLGVSVTGPPTVAEGEAAEFVVTATGGVGDEALTVSYTLEDSTATAGQDYTAPSGTLNIAADATSGTITIVTLEDEETDRDETLVVKLTAARTPDDEEVAVDPTPATTMIVDEGKVTVSVDDPEQPVVEGEPVIFTAVMSGTVSAGDVTLRFETADGTATAGQDYTAVPDGTVTIAAGQRSAAFTVVTLPDGSVEDSLETFRVSLSEGARGLPDGVELGASDAVTATARIADYALIASVTGPDDVAEGDTATFTVDLDGRANTTGVVVDYSVTGAATAPGDYTSPSGKLTIAAGQLEATIDIPTNDADELDDGETLVVTLTRVNADGWVARLHATDTSATATIRDGGRVTVSVAAATVEEGEPATFTITLSGPVSVPVTVGYMTQDDSATGSDYTAVPNGTVTIPALQTEATITVATTEDSDGEASETFTLTLSLPSPPTGVVLGDAKTATGTIIDDDLALLPLDDVTVAEGSTANITFMLERPLPEAVVLGYSIAGNAVAREDYTLSVPIIGDLPLPQGTIPVPANVQTGEVTVRAVDDSLAEGDESFTVTLAMVPTPGNAPAVLGQVTVTIKDNDELSVSVTAPRTVPEGSAAEFTVKLGGGESTAPVRVSYSLGGTAKAPADYTAPSPTMVVVPAGQQTAKFAIQTKTDKILEPDETLVVTLTSAETANGDARVGSPKSATTAIQDPVYHSINRVNQTLLPGITRASAAGALEAVSARMALAAQGDPPAATADLTGLTGLYRALLANEQALQDGSYDLARVLGGSSFLVPLSSHDGDSGGGVGVAVWGGGDFRAISGGDADADDVDWDGSVWSARLGADLRFVDSLLTGLAVSWTSGGLDYVDQLAPTDREGTYASWLISAYPYVGWTTPDFGLWATGGFGFGGVTIDDADEDIEPQEADLTQWSLGAGASVTLLSTDEFIAGGTTALKLKGEGFLAGATVAENEDKTIAELSVGVNQARAAIEASHAQHFAGRRLAEACAGDRRPLRRRRRRDRRWPGGGRRSDLRRSGIGTYGRGRRSRTADPRRQLRRMGTERPDSARPERGGPRPDDERAAHLGRDGERRQRAVGARYLRPAGRRQPAGRPRRGGDRLRPAGVRHGRRADPVRGSLAHRRGGAQPQPGRPPGAGTGLRPDPGGGAVRERRHRRRAGARRDPGRLDPLLTAA